jgi:acyl carrier protein
MKTTDSIAAEIHEFLRSTHVPDAQVTVDTDLIAAEHLDSLVVMDLVCFVDAHYGIRMQPEDVSPSNLQSVNRLARYVAANLSREAA